MPSSSLFLGSSTTLVSVLALFSTPVFGATQYVLNKEYSGSSFFDESNWNYFTDDDPTHGFVDYLSHDAALSAGLIQPGTNAYIGVDYKNPITNPNARGRPSVRIESVQSWTKGLFIASIDHMPGGICGTWPAFWTLSSKPWPSGGEIDIIEGANINAGYNVASLHTLSQCVISGDSRTMTGTLQSNNCKYYPDSNGPAGNTNAVGCGISSNDPTTYGNQNQFTPHVFAMEWTSDAIRMWAFPQGQVPADIDNNPDPTTWGLPSQTFNGPNCNIDASFVDHRMIFDNTFCGDYAGGYSWDNEGCAASTGYGKGNCPAFVAQNPSAFQQAYWSIEYVRVFQLAAVTTTAGTTTTTTTSGQNSPSTLTTTTTTTNSVSVNPTLGTTTNSAASNDPPAMGTTTTDLASNNPPAMGTTSMSSVFVNPTLGATTSGIVYPISGNLSVSPIGSNIRSSWTASNTWTDWQAVTSQPAQPTGASAWSDWAVSLAPTQLTQAIPQSKIFAAPAAGCPHCNYEQDQVYGFDNGGIIPGPKMGSNGANSNNNNGGSYNNNNNGGSYNNNNNGGSYNNNNNGGNYNNNNNGGSYNSWAGINTYTANANGAYNGGAAVAGATKTIGLVAASSQANAASLTGATSAAWTVWAEATSTATVSVIHMSYVPSASWGAWAGLANGTYSGPISQYTGGATTFSISMAVVLLSAIALVL